MEKSSSTIKRLRFQHTEDEKLDCELLTIDELRKRIPRADYTRTTRADFFRLIAVTSGTTRPVIDFTTLQASARHWLLIRPGQSMRYDLHATWSGWIVIFRPESISPRQRYAARDELDLLARIETMPSQWQLSARQSAHAHEALNVMHLDYLQSASPLERNALVRFQLAGMLLRLSLWQNQREPGRGAASPSNDMAALSNFKRFRSLLEKEFVRARQVQHYAQALGLSERTLNRACASAAGVSAKACIARRVCLEAKRLLAHTASPVQAIAFDLGFDEVTNFIKFFKRLEGMTPTDFRQHIAA
jgi:AraC-like DNA-binding protein